MARKLALLPSFAPAPRIAAASVLLGSARPTAVSCLVVPVRVCPIDRVIKAGPLTHVGKEALEGTPLLADSDASASVARVRGVAGISAPGQHGAPRYVGRRARVAMLVARRALARESRQFGLCLGRVRAGEARRSGLELAGVAQCVLVASAALRALQRSSVLIGQPRSPLRLADGASALFGHGVARAGAAGRACRAGLGMPLTGAAGFTLRHSSTVSGRLGQCDAKSGGLL